jgi:hypothetical protein
MKKEGIILVLFSIPLIFIGIILAVAVHEILGHGMGAELQGHNFTNFTLLPDGMGWANYEYTHPITPSEEKFILLAGPISTYIFALLFFILAFLFRKKFFISLTALILGAAQLLDGAPYMLWNSIFSSGGGDFGRFLAYNPDFKFLFIILGAIMTFGGLVFLNVYLYTLIRPKISNINRWYLLGLFFVIQVGAWLTFDWNQLAPGSGFLAPVSSLIVTALTLIFIGIKNVQYKQESFDYWKIQMIVSWIIGLIVLVLTLFWFSKGVAV